MILLIDNYDSFAYNLYQLVGSLHHSVEVVRNDTTTVEAIKNKNPKAIIISPGPGRPEDTGICLKTIQSLGTDIPILGVCLGHQAICLAYGATVSYSKELMHGKQSQAVLKRGCPLFAGCPATVPVARYHSLAVVEDTLPDCLTVTARTTDGEIMALQHKEFNIYGVQFHPESIMTPDGKTMINNFLSIVR